MKPLEGFHRDKSKRFGRTTLCIECSLKKHKLAYRKRVLENPNYCAEQYAKNREKSLASANRYAAKNYTKILSRAKQWYAINKARKRVYDEKRRLEKRELYRAAGKRFRENRPGRKNADTQARRAQFALRQPRWQSNTDMVVFYESAARVTQCLGIRHCVDHSIPLRGSNVSGLHVPGNLRVIPERFNLLKSNHFSLSPDGHIA